MKILELRLKNLNSLYGEWILDFTDPEYVSNGIFALTGPTGSGKSTILDAICLALYGATPRLGKITRSGNEIMSRQTGECYAEVVFASQAGRFRCHWEQRRARKKSDGNLQDYDHQIADAHTGKLIETKKSLVPGIVEENTGMDFDRFTRSILLAQGGFDTFLKAGVEEKSMILEQITGTGIYSEISKRVHERKREEKETLSLLQAEMSGIVILDPEQETAIQQEIETAQARETELAGQLVEIEKAIQWLQTIQGLQKEVADLEREAQHLQQELEAFKTERAKLQQANKAAELEGGYARVSAIRKEQADDENALNVQQEQLPQLESETHSLARALADAEQQAVNAKADLYAAMPSIQNVRSLDQKLKDQQKTIDEARQNYQKEVDQIASAQKKREKETARRGQVEKRLNQIDKYLKENARDEWLISGLAGIEQQLRHLASMQQEMTQTHQKRQKALNALKKAEKKLQKCADQCRARKQELDAISKKLHIERQTLDQLLAGRLLREYHTEKETLLREMAFLSRIAELEDYRTRLEDGKPCPLCGSKDHPFAHGNVPVPDETEKRIQDISQVIAQAEDQQTLIQKLEKDETAAKEKLMADEKSLATAEVDKQAVENAAAELAHGLEKLQSEFHHMKRDVTEELQDYGISEIPDKDPTVLLSDLKARLKTWQDKIRKKEGLEKQLATIDSELKGLDAVIETRTHSLKEKKIHLDTLQKEYTQKRDERQRLYGDKDPDKEENRLQQAVAEAEKAEKAARTQHTQSQEKLTTARAHVAALEQRISSRVGQLEAAESEFVSTLASAGFTDETAFLKVRLPANERDALMARAKALDDRQTELKARQTDRQDRLNAEISKHVTDQPLDQLEHRFKQTEQELKNLRDTLAGFHHQLRDNEAAKQRLKEKQTALEAQKQQCRRWEKLHELIGSADGKKYRNFAQGLTFEMVVSHANRQLEKMTDRYLLIRDTMQPLELNVIDNYQAGEIRSTRNLSGGESFIVSLSLALGLSRMASRNVRVDSLFLDEGFGTLDDDALDTALETLSGLHQDGKLIGIISHVSALKERISTQITITPISGGRSEIAGPGCRKA